MTKRFDLDADSLGEAYCYLVSRSEQLLFAGMELRLIRPVYLDGKAAAAMTVYADGRGKRYKAFYILKSMRGKGVYMRLLEKYPGAPVVTTPDCKMKEFLEAKSIPHKLVCEFMNNPHYKWIQEVYGDTRARRSGCYYMEHIDEGLALIQICGGITPPFTQSVKEAWCMHPILQTEALRKKHAKGLHKSKEIDPYSVMLATEYRSVANAYLNTMDYRLPRDIQLSEIPEVNAMLVADKVQNRKQFEQHRDKFTNAVNLDRYFKTWLERLEVSEERYQELADLITVSSGIPSEQRSKRWRKENS